MEVICKNVSELRSVSAIKGIEEEYKIIFPKTMVDFFEKNNGGNPLKKEFSIDDIEYEVRYFLSFNEDDYNEIITPMKDFFKETNGKILPLAKDSGDNYYCMHVETGKIYYWEEEENLYYNIAETFETFVGYLK